MDDETKQKAIEKANQLESLIAFPDWVTNVTTMNDYYKGICLFFLSSLLLFL